jgi:transposase
MRHVRERRRLEDGGGFCEVNIMEGIWSLLRSWLRPVRGISQEKLPHYLALFLALFEFVHNAKCRGKDLLSALLAALLPTTPKHP